MVDASIFAPSVFQCFGRESWYIIYVVCFPAKIGSDEPCTETNTQQVYELFQLLVLPVSLFLFFPPDSSIFFFSFREMMDGPVLLNLMSSFHFLSQLHGWLTVCPKAAVFIIHHAPFWFCRPPTRVMLWKSLVWRMRGYSYAESVLFKLPLRT